MFPRIFAQVFHLQNQVLFFKKSTTIPLLIDSHLISAFPSHNILCPSLLIYFAFCSVSQGSLLFCTCFWDGLG